MYMHIHMYTYRSKECLDNGDGVGRLLRDATSRKR